MLDQDGVRVRVTTLGDVIRAWGLDPGVCSLRGLLVACLLLLSREAQDQSMVLIGALNHLPPLFPS